MTECTIRVAVLPERGALEALQWRASLANERDRTALIAHPDAIHIPEAQVEKGWVFIAERDGGMAGFAAVLPRDDGDTELDGLFVEPELWKQGIGRALVNRCLEHARQAGAAALHVIGGIDAEGFYNACGFVTLGSCETRFGPALRLRRPLD